jgi:hypothetical protein
VSEATLTYEALLAAVEQIEAPTEVERQIEAKLRAQIAQTGATPTHILVPKNDGEEWTARRVGKRLGLEVRASRWLTTPGQWYLVNATLKPWSR